MSRSSSKAGLALTIVLLTSTAALAQSDQAKTSAYFELFGNGGLFSINLERKLTTGIAARIGIGHWSGQGFFGEDIAVTSVPLLLTGRFGAGNHGFEIGGGFVPGRTHDGGFLTLTGVIGYRFERIPKGTVFRVGFTPLYGLGSGDTAYPDKGFFPSFGVSYGYAFR